MLKYQQNKPLRIQSASSILLLIRCDRAEEKTIHAPVRPEIMQNAQVFQRVVVGRLLIRTGSDKKLVSPVYSSLMARNHA